MQKCNKSMRRQCALGVFKETLPQHKVFELFSIECNFKYASSTQGEMAQGFIYVLRRKCQYAKSKIKLIQNRWSGNLYLCRAVCQRAFQRNIDKTSVAVNMITYSSVKQGFGRVTPRIDCAVSQHHSSGHFSSIIYGSKAGCTSTTYECWLTEIFCKGLFEIDRWWFFR